MFANQISAGQLLMNFLSKAKGEIEENISSSCFARELQQQQAGKTDATSAPVEQGQGVSSTSRGDLLSSGAAGLQLSPAFSVDSKGIEQVAVSSGQSTPVVFSGRRSRNGLVTGLESSKAIRMGEKSAKVERSFSQTVASANKSKTNAKLENDYSVTDALQLERVLAQLQVPAEARQSCMATADAQGGVSLSNLAQILGQQVGESGSASGKPQAAQGKVSVAEVRRLLGSIRSSGGTQTPGSVSSELQDQSNLKSDGSYTLPEFRELLGRVIKKTQAEALGKGTGGLTTAVSNGSGNAVGEGTAVALEKGPTGESHRLAGSVMPSFVREKEQDGGAFSISGLSAGHSSGSKSSSQSSLSATQPAAQGKDVAGASIPEKMAAEQSEAAENNDQNDQIGAGTASRQILASSLPERTKLAGERASVATGLFTSVDVSEETVVTRPVIESTIPLQAKAETAVESSASALGETSVSGSQARILVSGGKEGISLTEALRGWELPLQGAAAQGKIQVLDGKTSADRPAANYAHDGNAEGEIVGIPRLDSLKASLASHDGETLQQDQQQATSSDSQGIAALRSASSLYKGASVGGISPSFRVLMDDQVADSSVVSPAAPSTSASSASRSFFDTSWIANPPVSIASDTPFPARSFASGTQEKITISAEILRDGSAPPEATSGEERMQIRYGDAPVDGQDSQDSQVEDFSSVGSVEKEVVGLTRAGSFKTQSVSNDEDGMRQDQQSLQPSTRSEAAAKVVTPVETYGGMSAPLEETAAESVVEPRDAESRVKGLAGAERTAEKEVIGLTRTGSFKAGLASFDEGEVRQDQQSLQPSTRSEAATKVVTPVETYGGMSAPLGETAAESVIEPRDAESRVTGLAGAERTAEKEVIGLPRTGSFKAGLASFDEGGVRQGQQSVQPSTRSEAAATNVVTPVETYGGMSAPLGETAAESVIEPRDAESRVKGLAGAERAAEKEVIGLTRTGSFKAGLASFDEAGVRQDQQSLQPSTRSEAAESVIEPRDAESRVTGLAGAERAAEKEVIGLPRTGSFKAGLASFDEDGVRQDQQSVQPSTRSEAAATKVVTPVETYGGMSAPLGETSIQQASAQEATLLQNGDTSMDGQPEDSSEAGSVDKESVNAPHTDFHKTQLASRDGGASRQDRQSMNSDSQDTLSSQDSRPVNDAAADAKGASSSFDALVDDSPAASPVASSGPAGTTATSQSSSASSSVRVNTTDPSAAQELAERVIELHGRKRHQLSLELDPQHLGKVLLQVETRGDTVSACLHTETEQARQWLLRNQTELQQHLQDQGLSLSQFSVNVGDQQNGRQSGQQDNAFGHMEGLDKVNQASARATTASGNMSSRRSSWMASNQRLSVFA